MGCRDNRAPHPSRLGGGVIEVDREGEAPVEPGENHPEFDSAVAPVMDLPSPVDPTKEGKAITRGRSTLEAADQVSALFLADKIRRTHTASLKRSNHQRVMSTV